MVDDYIPMRMSTKTFEGGKSVTGWHPVFAQSRILGELWPMIAEKAWAKLIGSYEAISGGEPQSVTQYLTDDPGRVVRLRKPCYGCPHVAS